MRIILDFIGQSQRVMKVARKPSYGEFERMFKIVAFAALIIGFLGFIINLVFTLF